MCNYFNPETRNSEEFIAEITGYVANMDFAAISYYPFVKGQRNTNEFQESFDFLHKKVNIPISIVETNHLAEDLVVESFNVNISSDECEQREYLETLLQNAHLYNYEFIIWGAHRDYDPLWDTFSDDVKDIGRLWRDTSLLNEEGNPRAGLTSWREILAK